MHQSVLKGDMPKKAAADVLKKMNPNKPMASREEFARLVAALVAVYSQKLDVVRRGKTTLRKSLAAACKPQRAEWYFNNMRYRSRLSPKENAFLGTGTSRNEQVHATLKSEYASTVRISKRMLNAQLKTWVAAEMSIFLRAMESDTTVRIRRADLRQIVIAGISLFTTSTWSAHVASPSTTWTSGAKSQRNPRRQRSGAVAEQSAVYEAIRSKMPQKRRSSVYAAHTEKRLRVR